MAQRGAPVAASHARSCPCWPSVKNQLAVHRRCAARSAPLHDVAARIRLLPPHGTRGRVEAEDRVLLAIPTHRVSRAVPDRHGGVPFARLLPPGDAWQTILRPARQPARLGRDAVTLRSAPLRPIVGRNGWLYPEESEKRTRRAHQRRNPGDERYPPHGRRSKSRNEQKVSNTPS